jgi:hypothetical protein
MGREERLALTHGPVRRVVPSDRAAEALEEAGVGHRSSFPGARPTTISLALPHRLQMQRQRPTIQISASLYFT